LNTTERPHIRPQAYPHYPVGSINLSHGGGLNPRVPTVRKDRTMGYAERMQAGDAGLMATDEATPRTTAS
jgi:hypothetical protein